VRKLNNGQAGNAILRLLSTLLVLIPNPPKLRHQIVVGVRKINDGEFSRVPHRRFFSQERMTYLLDEASVKVGYRECGQVENHSKEVSQIRCR